LALDSVREVLREPDRAGAVAVDRDSDVGKGGAQDVEPVTVVRGLLGVTDLVKMTGLTRGRIDKAITALGIGGRKQLKMRLHGRSNVCSLAKRPAADATAPQPAEATLVRVLNAFEAVDRTGPTGGMIYALRAARETELPPAVVIRAAEWLCDQDPPRLTRVEQIPGRYNQEHMYRLPGAESDAEPTITAVMHTEDNPPITVNAVTHPASAPDQPAAPEPVPLTEADLREMLSHLVALIAGDAQAPERLREMAAWADAISKDWPAAVARCWPTEPYEVRARRGDDDVVVGKLRFTPNRELNPRRVAWCIAARRSSPHIAKPRCTRTGA
jgi:hypothetical protein